MRKPSSNLVHNVMSRLIHEKPVETATNPELSLPNIELELLKPQFREVPFETQVFEK